MRSKELRYGKTVANIAAIAEEVADSVDRHTVATDGIAESANRAAGSANAVAEALKIVADAIQQTQADAAGCSICRAS